MEHITISKDHLNTICDRNAKILVGKCMKRFEVLKTQDAVKASLKEIIYEHHRNLKELMIAFSCGVKFITKPKQD